MHSAASPAYIRTAAAYVLRRPLNFNRLQKLCQLSSYEIATTIEELNVARDTEGRPVLERISQKMIMSASKQGAKVLERREMIRRRQGSMDFTSEDPLLQPIAFTPGKIRWIFCLCWFNIIRCFVYGLTSGFLNYGTEIVSTTYFPINPDATPNFNDYNLYVFYLISFGPGFIFSFIEALTISYDFLSTAIRITNSVDVSLYKDPMDPIRVFICNAIISEALELGHPNNVRCARAQPGCLLLCCPSLVERRRHRTLN